MPRLIIATAFCLCSAYVASIVGANEPGQSVSAVKRSSNGTDWPWWRGPERNGVASPDQQPPLSWNETENVVWKSPVPGRGHGSPIVVGDQVFLLTAEHDREVQSVICYSRKSGE
ncbi:MAG: serine/threonine protein kinase, partial [Schlesneria sp.]